MQTNSKRKNNSTRVEVKFQIKDFLDCLVTYLLCTNMAVCPIANFSLGEVIRC